MQKFIVFSLAALFITSCGQLNTDGSSTVGGGGGGSGNVGFGRGVIKSGGTTVAHVVSFLSGSRVFVYIPSALKYASVHLESGTYSSNVRLYFTSDNCSGSGYTNTDWLGEIGKTIVSDGTNYWSISSRVNPAVTLNIESREEAGVLSTVCDSSFSGTVALNEHCGVLTATTRPYDFTAIAPLTITYE